MKDMPSKTIVLPHDEHLARVNDPARLKALNQSGLMTQMQDAAFDRAVRLAKRALGAPVSLVSFVDDKQQCFRAKEAPDDTPLPSSTPLSHSFCQYVVSSEMPLIVRDARQDSVLYKNGAVEDLNVAAYLGVPIRTTDGHVLGSFCTIDTKPRDWSDDDIEAMRDLADTLETELALRETVSERDIVLQEMNHRVKNLFSVVNSMIRMERRFHDTTEEFAKSMAARIDALDAAHQMIVPVVNAGRANASGAMLGDLCRKILAPHTDSQQRRIVITGEDMNVGSKAVVYLTLALHELATNSAKYGALDAEAGRLEISWTRETADTGEEYVALDWVETGCIWGAEIPKSKGFGSRLLTISVEGHLRGTISTAVEPTQFSHQIRFPLDALAQ